MKLTPITNPVALRLDTTAGTRIFAGDTMIYGDTGTRTVLDFDTSGNPTLGTIPPGWNVISGVSGGIQWQRVGAEVSLYIGGLRAATTESQLSVPAGFAPGGLPYTLIIIPSADGVATAKVGATQIFITTPRDGFAFPDSNGTYRSEATWRTNRPWPITLPGLPA